MTTNTVPDVPYRSPIQDQNGLLTQAWATWFRQLFLRAGGNSAPTNSDISTLQTTVTALQATVNTQAAEIATLNSNLMNQNSLTQGTAL